MATYAIGDIQGCYTALQQLLKKIQFDKTKDKLWLTGDLVNRGAQSLEVLRFAKFLGSACEVVLGNHDLHLLAIAHGVRQANHHDTFHDVLSADDRDDLMHWLITRPLLVCDDVRRIVMTHAGMAPCWSISEAKQYAHELEQALRGAHAKDVLAHLFGNTPDVWSESLTGMERLRCIVNYLTRMRYCDAEARLNFTVKVPLAECPPDLMPWFAAPHRKDTDWKIIFGHWASLKGETHTSNVFALDTGCAWGECLTALCLETNERVAVSCVTG
ncbi:MAG TPA: symmetrical bis(5'-nucleosyl)-tetraphosphatase [Gammaproteobacteria bacterium]|nr:symmetrical bis(5'-nucleosyl)-tetraphosphatase [Gammaproteobacteria bacterium]